MTVVGTDMRITREAADRLRYEPGGTNSATNVQEAIEAVGGGGGGGTSPPAITPTIVNFAMSPYSALVTDYLILVDTSGGAVVINLGAAAGRGNKEITIKDSSGNAATNNVTINRNGADTIDGLTALTLASDFDSATLAPKTGGYART